MLGPHFLQYLECHANSTVLHHGLYTMAVAETRQTYIASTQGFSQMGDQHDWLRHWKASVGTDFMGH